MTYEPGYDAMDLLNITDKEPVNSQTIHTDSELGEFNQISSVQCHSSELLRHIAHVSEKISFDNASNSISSSSDHEISKYMDFYFNENDEALNFNSIMGFTNNTASTASNQLNNHHWEINEMSKLFPFQNRLWACQNYADSTVSYQSSQYTSQNHDIDIFLNMDELNMQSPLQNMSGMGLDDGVDGTTFQLSFGTEIENKICLEDIDFGVEEYPDLMEIDSFLETQIKKRNTLVLDLDETLVHSTKGGCNNVANSFIMYNFRIMHDNIPIYVMERPHLRCFLERVAGLFEIVIFTAGTRIYASKVLNELDPEGKFFSRRFYRDSCKPFMEGGYVKDLTILGVDLAKVAIIDNTPKVYRLQRENGIPIKSWYDDPSDIELIRLLPFLETLAEADDVRPLISKTFNVIGNNGTVLCILCDGKFLKPQDPSSNGC
ncbi:CTD small phosphatase-like protein [Rhynchospora pubera]|uniref:CTD small phosphatase-like protein n=1 Tax=Rhynchospora pubera TaxID=906938 RepID=A0AAV8F9V2_9POAL|nr:CTD small phosphatase-like protein [Rhynchospora pubera]